MRLISATDKSSLKIVKEAIKETVARFILARNKRCLEQDFTNHLL